MMDVGKRMKEHRLLQSLSQQELAQRIGCSKRTIERLEAGGTAHPKTVREIAEALKIPVSVLTKPMNKQTNIESDADKLKRTISMLEELLSLLDSIVPVMNNDQYNVIARISAETADLRDGTDV
jgi:transcriptional regulator with XRE-family HTH domain